MTIHLDSIRDKVRSILERANHPNTPQAEAETALSLAYRLMKKYDLDEYEITKLMNRSNFALFLGKAGSGKSTLLISLLQSPSLFKKVYHNIILFCPPNSRASTKNDF